jgi:Protein of unknown function (DUF2939)
MRKWLLVALAALLLVAYLVSPYFALYRIDVALQQRDSVALERYADWPALRDQLRSDFNGLVAGMIATQQQGQSDSAGKFAAGFISLLGPVMVDRLVDTYVSPDGFIKMLNEQTASQGERHLRDFITYALFAGPMDFRVDLRKPGDPKAPQVTALLEFSAMGWRAWRNGAEKSRTIFIAAKAATKTIVKRLVMAAVSKMSPVRHTAPVASVTGSVPLARYSRT